MSSVASTPTPTPTESSEAWREYVNGHITALNDARERRHQLMMNDTRNWMQQRIQRDALWAQNTLQQITIPGTHDSGAYWLTTELSPDATGSAILDALIEVAEKLGVPINDVITPWALAQDTNFYEQAIAGIRYFDLRSCWNGSEWRTFHFELGHTVDILLRHLKQFLDEQRSEVIVVEVSHLLGKPTLPQKAKLISMIDQILGEYLYPRSGGFNDSISSMIAKNQRVVLSVDDDDAIKDHPAIWPGSTMHNSYANSDNITVMLSYNDDRAKEYNNQTWPLQLYKISWTLTPGPLTILRSLEKGEPRSLLQLADVANARLDEWVARQKAQGLRLGNLFLIDHFENSDVVDIVKMF